MEDPDDILEFNAANGTETEDQARAQIDLKELSEDDFQSRYKATKRQFRALTAGLQMLDECYNALSEPGPLEIDTEIIDSTQYLREDFVRLLEQMHLAAYWENEGGM